MNKQVFQQKIKDMKPPKFFTAISLGEAYEAGFEEARVNALLAFDFLDELEKPVVPQYVADMIVEKKKQKYGIVDTIKSLWAFNDPFDLVVEKQIDWVVENQEDFAKAWLYGYEVEKDKLYTVEIPNNNQPDHLVLWKYAKEEVCINRLLSDNWRDYKRVQLTEAEIKKDFEWAWQFAEEVEE